MENNIIETKSYYVEGFSCANCAKSFEENVKSLKGVKTAKVNFGASKIAVTGIASIKELEKAGAFENLKISEEKKVNNESRKFNHFIKEYHKLIIGVLLLGLGIASNYIGNENNLITILLFLSSILISGYQLLLAGTKNLTRLIFDMKTLMTIAVIGGAIIGEWSEVAIVVILFSLSEALERLSMDKARKSISALVDNAPKEALIRKNGIDVLTNVRNILINDIMIVRPGDKISMDGIVISGTSSVNEAAITGESIPLVKVINSNVYAGTLNAEGLLEIKVTKLVEDTTIAKIIHLVEEAQNEKAPSQRFVDTFSKYYTPIIMLLAVLVILIPPLFFDGQWSTWIYQGLAILVVGCPCALVISTPIAIVSAIGNAAKEGILVKGGIYLEKMGKVDAIAFDKTGTLTIGKPVLTNIVAFDESYTKDDLIKYASVLEKNSSHPLANAIINYAKDHNIDYNHVNLTNYKSHVGMGLEGIINEEKFYIGNIKLFNNSTEYDFTDENLITINEMEKSGKTVMIIGTKGKIIGMLAVADIARTESKEVIDQLLKLNINEIYMLSGDNKNTASAIASSLNINLVHAELMPEDKLVIINDLEKEHKNVIMVGDGVNDAPALARASVGIAMGGTGTDTALETSDVVLMGDNLSKLPYIIKLSRKTLNVIKSNITFAVGIKLVALLLIVPGYLTLWIAIASDMGATLLVALNSMRLMRKEKVVKLK